MMAGHPKRPRSEAAAFGRLIDAELAGGARTLGAAMLRVRRRDPRRWGMQRKMESLWAEYKEIKRNEAAAARLAEKMSAQLAAFERDMAKLEEQLASQIERIDAEFARNNPRAIELLNRLQKTTQ
jgi:hypothetical protein